MIFFIKVVPWILLAGLIITWTPWRSIFEKIFGNNPTRAKVYVEIGEQDELCKGKLIRETPKGFVYRYKCFGVSYSVIVPFDYPYRYVLGCRKIRVIFGHATAAPLGGMATTSVKVSGADLDLILQSKIGAELVKTIFGKAINYLTILIILGVLIFAGYFMMKQFGIIGTPGQPGQPAQQTPVEQTGPKQPLE